MKRRAFKLLLFLFAGAIINIAVAWGVVLAHGPIQQDWCPYHNPVVRDELPLIVHVTSRFGLDIVSGCDRSGTLLARHADKVQTYKPSVWWTSEAVESLSNNYAIACGWPSFALTSWRTMPGENEMAFPGVINCGIAWPLPAAQRSQFDVETVPTILATSPVWPGFAINTIFYAAILWLLFAAPFAIRKRVRRKRGQCTACGYSLRESVSEQCPECGRPTPSPALSLKRERAGVRVE